MDGSNSFQNPSRTFQPMFVYIAVFLMLTGLSATIEVKANLSDSNVQQVYAIAESPSGKLLTIQMKLNPTSKLFEGASETEEAGNYKVTIFAIQEFQGKTIKTNSTFETPFFVDDCKTSPNCKTIGSNFICNENKKCEACKCGLDSICNKCCSQVNIEDFDCKLQKEEEKREDIILQVDASERGMLKIIAFENIVQDLQVTAEKGGAVSEIKNVRGLRTSIPATNLSLSIQLPSGKIINAKTDETGFARIQIGKDENGNITIIAGKTGKISTQVNVAVKGIAKGLIQAKEAAIVTANIAAVPAAAIGGWALVSFLSQLGIIFQSLLTAQLSLSRAQVGRLKSAVQLIMLSFLLFSLRKLLNILNLGQITGINFELTYAISEVIFFVVFLIGILDLNSAMTDISSKSEKEKKLQNKK